MHIFWQLLINFGPVLLIIAVFGYFVKRGPKKQADYFEFAKGYMSDHLVEVRQLNANLERIAGALEASDGRASAHASHI